MELVFEGKGGYKLERESFKDKLVVGRSYQVAGRESYDVLYEENIK